MGLSHFQSNQRIAECGEVELNIGESTRGAGVCGAISGESRGFEITAQTKARAESPLLKQKILHLKLLTSGQSLTKETVVGNWPKVHLPSCY